jgi:hypothetical protein
VSNRRRSLAGRAFVAVVVIVCLAGWSAYARDVSGGLFLNPSESERELLRFVETLPKDTLLAGTPRALDNVPLFAKRQILFSHEQPGGGTDLIRRALNAYYAKDEQEVLDFCQAYGVDYLVIDLEAYSEGYMAKRGVFWEPYNRELLSRIADRKAFTLAHIPNEVKIFRSDSFFVIPCDALAAQDYPGSVGMDHPNIYATFTRFML